MMLYRIGTIARLVGVEVATLRNWEQRYGLVVASRSAGGHRLYSGEDLEKLRWLTERTSGGLSAGVAHALLHERLRSATAARVRRDSKIGRDAQHLHARALAATARSAEVRARAKRNIMQAVRLTGDLQSLQQAQSTRRHRVLRDSQFVEDG